MDVLPQLFFPTRRLMFRSSDSEYVKFGVPVLVGAAGTGFALKFGRDEELEADKLGMRYMSLAGYDPSAQLDVMEVLASESAERTPGMEFLSTHPYPSTRIERIEIQLREFYPNATGERDALRYRSRMLMKIDLSEN